MSVGKPERAHTLTLTIGADTLADIAGELRNFASRIERDQVRTGAIGGGSVGTVYAYTHRPEMTHARYFSDLNAWLVDHGYGA